MIASRARRAQTQRLTLSPRVSRLARRWRSIAREMERISDADDRSLDATYRRLARECEPALDAFLIAISDELDGEGI